MKYLAFGRRALVACFSAVTISACGSGISTNGMPPSGKGNFAAGAAPGHGKIMAACPDRGPADMQCMALILDGMPIRDGGTGPSGGFAPADLQTAYNLPSASKGSGQIVAIVDSLDDPNVASDLAYYRSYFGLPPATFYKFNQRGQQYNYPKSCTKSPRGGWCVEIPLDVEMVSAACPNCTIYLVEANSNKSRDAAAAETEAVKLGAHIVSNSFGCKGPAKCPIIRRGWDTPGVVYVASSGDTGYGAWYPAKLDSVVSVGGTHLVQGGQRGWTETVWGGAGFWPWGTGGGCTNGSKPSWQHDPGCRYRTANDIAAVADPFTGVSEYDTYGGYTGWLIIGGTSVSAPLIAGVFALAGNATSQRGGRTFWETQHERPDDLNPVLRGSDGHCSPTYLCTAGTHEYKKYSGPTGWGTPNGIGAF